MRKPSRGAGNARRPIDVRIVQYGGLRWHVQATDADALQAWLRQHWTAASDGPRHLVKADAGGQVSIAGGMVLKVYRRRAGAGGRIAGCLRSRARRAFRFGHLLAGRGLPVPRPVAWAVARRYGAVHEEYLITREVPGARLLQHWLAQSTLDAGVRDAILDQLGALLGGFHRAGVTNRDFKDGNVLVAETASGVAVFGVDMDGVRRVRLTGQRLIGRDLLPVVNSLALYGWDTEPALHRLLASYCAASGNACDEAILPYPTDRVDRVAAGWEVRRRTVRLKALGTRTLDIHTPRELPEWKRLGLCFWQGRLPGLAAVRSSPEAVVHVGDVASDGRRYYFKRFLMRSAADRVKHLVRRSRARRAWLGGARMAEQGLHVPPVVCVVEERVYGVVRGSGLVTEAVPGALPLDALLAGGVDGGGLAWQDRRALLGALAREVARLHAAGLVHGDMRHGNILCVCDATRGAGEGAVCFHWLDNERTRACARRHERARNLVQLNMLAPGVVSRTDRLRFWQAYVAARGLAEKDAARLLQHVLDWTSRRWRERLVEANAGPTSLAAVRVL
jgi:tRNA A-37 threonylcarbamoyl transferase component Bud32